MKILTFNIHYSDGLDIYPWDLRKGIVASVIKLRQVDIASLQEAFLPQVKDLEVLLEEYDWFGLGLEDKKSLGPHDPIFFKKKNFDLLDSGVFYLSKTPDFPSKDWGAKYTRGVIYVKLREKLSQKPFFVFNTHFDYHSLEARDNGVPVLHEYVRKIAGGVPYIVLGDFNLFSQMQGEKTYNKLIEEFIDARAISKKKPQGPMGTWTGFEQAGSSGERPDCVFVSNGIEVLDYKTIIDTFAGKFPSDHLPVMVDVNI